jgi:hypothetical protein
MAKDFEFAPALVIIRFGFRPIETANQVCRLGNENPTLKCYLHKNEKTDDIMK